MSASTGGDDPRTGDLIERAKRGDGAAFGELVRKYQRRVYATAFHMTGNHGDADDVAQEAFLRAYKAIAGFDGRADFFTWLYRIVVNVSLNTLRARKSHASLGDGDESVADPVENPVRTAEGRELVAQVVRALSELPDSLRITLVLATLEEMPYRQIAETLEIPEGTVAWRVNQARKQLRRKLAALAPEAPGAVEGTTDDLLRRSREALGAP
jgi:RNA polymerase sigma-70 factor (ECF subfamily)